MIKRLKSLKKHSFSVFVATVVEGKPKGGNEDGDGARNDRDRERKSSPLQKHANQLRKVHNFYTKYFKYVY